MNPNDPWATPPHAVKGERSAEAIYLGVGRALDVWERFESTLACLYSGVIDPDRPNPAATRAFGSLAAFTARAESLEQAGAVHFTRRPNEPVQRQFGSLLKIARRASPRRNDIAHGQVWLSDADPKSDWGGGYFLGPAGYNSRRRSIAGEPQYSYSRTELDAFAERFSVLWLAANELFNAVCYAHPLQPIELLPRSGTPLEATLPEYLKLPAESRGYSPH